MWEGLGAPMISRRASPPSRTLPSRPPPLPCARC